MDRVRDLVQSLGLDWEERLNGAYIGHPGSLMDLGIERISDQEIFAFGICHTTSWDWAGDRTDLNDVFSHFAAASLRFVGGISSRLIDVPHPVSEFVDSPLHARYLTFDQPNGSFFSTRDDSSANELVRVLVIVHSNEKYLPPPSDARDGAVQWIGLDENDRRCLEMAHALRNMYSTTDPFANVRYEPDWFYYRTRRGFVVVQSAALADLLRSLAESHAAKANLEQVVGPTGVFQVDAKLRNFVPSGVLRKVQTIFYRLEGLSDLAELIICPLENSLICAGSQHTLFVPCDCGAARFDIERTKLEPRHMKEATVLFAPIDFEWADSVDEDRFESMIHELLSEEPGITWIRKVGSTRDRDRGRDLLCEWSTPLSSGEAAVEGETPIRRRSLVVQCKVRKRAVSKSDVPDLYDTIRFHEADGFFLAVSSHLTAPLVETLEKLRRTYDLYADWWGKHEIEERLRRMPAVAARYSDLVWRT